MENWDKNVQKGNEKKFFDNSRKILIVAWSKKAEKKLPAF